jgi:hypothetical protein
MPAAAPRTVDGYALPGDLTSHPRLCGIPVDERLVTVARALLGAPPVHFRDSAVGIGGSLRGWHKDNRNSDRYAPDGEDWQGDYPLVRMGIYCEDHARHSGGLAVRRGSHRLSDAPRVRVARTFWGAVRRVRNGPHVRELATGMLHAGRPVHVASRAGDLVAWNMRITHQGHTVRPRGLPGLKLPPVFENRLPAALQRPEECERVAIFLSYGAPSHHTDRFVEWLKERDYFAPRTRDRPMCEEVAAAVPAGLTLLDPWVGAGHEAAA